MTLHLSKRQYQTLAQIVYDECGINMHAGKLQLLTTRVAKRLRATGIDSVDEYIGLLKKSENELVHYIDAVSTNHTFFFRENHHLEFVLKTVGNTCFLRIWCAASSSGEEPYSLAVQLKHNGYKFEIYASDISTDMLSLAQRGVYHKSKLTLVPREILINYFQKGRGRWADHLKVKKEIMQLVSYDRHNLITDQSPGVFDIIFCRNVMIYFDDDTKQKVVDKLYASLERNGYLIFGAAESLVGIQHSFKYIQPSIYMKTGD
ncbi:MAG: protein-glutamate O-methyltransferase CheR [Desulfatiglans sp.]|jgi:chemotaxis protein methyltransferase CheR|nr:protein-glutamate O-methyltransferase CheR [Thermodesulfobacteriota bacterium]MEE4351429.1 protein-glutamate O-methyltransferase CheR [Desulfatiglans sp.]